MKKGTLAFGAATALLVAMGFSNPNVEEHQSKLTSILTKIADSGEDDGLFGQEGSSVAITDPVAQRQAEIVTHTMQHVSSTFIETGVKTTLKVTDYLLCSVGEIDKSDLKIEGVDSLSDESEVVTIGVCGHVFTLNKDDLLGLIKQ